MFEKFEKIVQDNQKLVKNKKDRSWRWLNNFEILFIEYLKKNKLFIFDISNNKIELFFKLQNISKEKLITNLKRKKYLWNLTTWIYYLSRINFDINELILIYLKIISKKRKKILKYYFWWINSANEFWLTEQIWNWYIVYNNIISWIKNIDWKKVIFKKINKYYESMERKWKIYATINQTIIDTIESPDYIQNDYQNIIYSLENNKNINLDTIFKLYDLNNNKFWFKRLLYLLNFTSKSIPNYDKDLIIRRKITLSKKSNLNNVIYI